MEDARLFGHWENILYPEFHWIATDITAQDRQNTSAILSIVDRIIETVDDDPMDPVTSVFQSSVWAVCMAYKDFKTGIRVLSEPEFQYASNRGGIIGLNLNDHSFLSVRKLLVTLDPSFDGFKRPQNAPSP